MNEEMIELLKNELKSLKLLNEKLLNEFNFVKYEENIKNIKLLFENFNSNFLIDLPIFKSKAKNLETDLIFFKNNFEKELHKILLNLNKKEEKEFKILTSYIENQDKSISLMTFILNFEFAENKVKEETIKKIQQMFEK